MWGEPRLLEEDRLGGRAVETLRGALEHGVDADAHRDSAVARALADRWGYTALLWNQ